MSGVYAVPTEFARSYAGLVDFNSTYICGQNREIHYSYAPFSDHAPARNHLVENMRGDWLLMLDTDHQFQPDLLARMLDRMIRGGFDVLTGLYRFKNRPHTPVLYSWKDDDLRPLAKVPKTPIFQVGGAGAGCLLVKRRVYEKIWNTYNEGPFDRIFPHSEDLSFFYRLRRLGIPAYCDSRIEVPHLRAVGVGPDADDSEPECEEIEVEVLAAA